MSKSIAVDPLAASGWQMLLTLVKPGGLVARSVRHYDCYFATDIRVTKIFLSDKDEPAPGEPWEYELGSDAIPAETDINVTNIEGDGIRPFTAARMWSAWFKTADGFVGKGSPRLSVRQTYVVTDYGSSPAHEPTGTLQAARFYPLVTIYDPSVAGELIRLRYARVDYRLGLTCGNSPTAHFAPRPGRPPNQAGVFRDADVLTFPVTASSLFPAAEKPLKYEIIGRGLVGGKPSKWDNIHQWIAGEPIATPGAQYAIHNHWRWSAAASGSPTLAAPAPGPQFSGQGGKPGSPLIDPRASQQAMSFAITAAGSPTTGPEPKAWTAESNGATPDFDRLFTDVRAKPVEIEQGADLTTWMSFEVFRDPKADGPSSFTIFVHGLFFAHNIQRERHPLLFAVGAYADRQIPAPTRKWVRPY